MNERDKKLIKAGLKIASNNFTEEAESMEKNIYFSREHKDKLINNRKYHIKEWSRIITELE